MLTGGGGAGSGRQCARPLFPPLREEGGVGVLPCGKGSSGDADLPGMSLGNCRHSPARSPVIFPYPHILAYQTNAEPIDLSILGLVGARNDVLAIRDRAQPALVRI